MKTMTMEMVWREGQNSKGFYIEKDLLRKMLNKQDKVILYILDEKMVNDKHIPHTYKVNHSIGSILTKLANLDTYTCVIEIDEKYQEIVSEYKNPIIALDYSGQQAEKICNCCITLEDNESACIIGARLGEKVL